MRNATSRARRCSFVGFAVRVPIYLRSGAGRGPWYAPPTHRTRRGRPVETSLSSLIASAEGGDRAASDALFATLYAELHRLASRQLARSSGALTIGTTTLLHEAYLNMSRR